MHGHDVELGTVVVHLLRVTAVWHCSCLGTMVLTCLHVEIFNFLNSLQLICFIVLGLFEENIPLLPPCSNLILTLSQSLAYKYLEASMMVTLKVDS